MAYIVSPTFTFLAGCKNRSRALLTLSKRSRKIAFPINWGWVKKVGVHVELSGTLVRAIAIAIAYI